MKSGQMISAGILAGAIEATGNVGPLIGHQVNMTGSDIRIYITPEIARQWLPVLAQIAAAE